MMKQDTVLALPAWVADRPLLLYHWSPPGRRPGITRYGLRPGMRPSSTVCGSGWRSPYVCLAESPALAWELSGEQPETRRGEWDLWLIDTTAAAATLDAVGVEVLSGCECGGFAREYRVYGRLWKRDVTYIGSRRVT